MSQKVKAAILGSFLGDTLALGVHWVYEPEKIKKAYGEIETPVAPMLADYHKGKNAGDLTHYGDQMYELLISVSTGDAFDPQNFMTRWTTLFRDYHGYYDKATRDTLDRFDKGISLEEVGSGSSDLGGASRIAPLLIAYKGDREELFEMARAQTRLTHNHPKVIAAAGFFADLAYRIIHGQEPVEAIKILLESEGEYGAIADLVEKGLESVGEPTTEAIGKLGPSCGVEGALPGTIHLIASYPDDYRTAMVRNVMAGGDSAARGMLAGMVLGAAGGMEVLPDSWLEALVAEKEIAGFTDQRLHKHYWQAEGGVRHVG